uniref:Lysine-specific metallo-endopeptidase domain-containing protein n=1 Tax=Amphimedon queenslandica TaxID=400682 RepID=A0A1X7UD83_AMPQE
MVVHFIVANVNIQSCTDAKFYHGDNQNKETLAANRRLCAGIAKAIANISDNEDYVTWLGEYTPERAAKVKDSLTNIKDSLNEKDVGYVNNHHPCHGEAAAARVNYLRLFLCEPYYGYQLDCSGTVESKEFTLISFWDKAYGGGIFGAAGDGRKDPEFFKALAKQHPDYAIENYYSIGFFYCASQK